MLAATSNQHSSGLRRVCSISTIDNDVMVSILCPSVLSAPTFMTCFYAYNAILQPPHTMRRVGAEGHSIKAIMSISMVAVLEHRLSPDEA